MSNHFSMGAINKLNNKKYTKRRTLKIYKD